MAVRRSNATQNDVAGQKTALRPTPSSISTGADHEEPFHVMPFP